MNPERELLAAVLEALTLPHDVADYDKRLLARAGWAQVTVHDALEGAGDMGWNADFLRSKIRAEEAEHRGGRP